MNILVFHKPAMTVTVLCAILGLAACGDPEADYFPLDSGSVWIYRQTVQIDNHGNSGGRETHRSVVAATNLAPRMSGETRLVPRIHADGRTLYYEEAGDGIVLAASRAAYKEDIEPIAPRYVIKYPIEAGMTWKKPSETEILRRSFLGTFGTISKRIRVEGDMEYEIQSLDDTVRVPAGVFRHCLRVQGIGRGVLQWGEPFGTVEVTVKSIEWYAPSVGLVKRIREESTGQGGPLAARLQEELTARLDSAWFH